MSKLLLVHHNIKTGETVAQGSFGGGIVSAANLDDGVQDFFADSQDEVCYGNIPLKPLLYQDDILRATTTVSGAQNGLNKIWNVMNMKLLDIHTDKSCHLIIANKNNMEKIQQDITMSPLIYNNDKIKEKDKKNG